MKTYIAITLGPIYKLTGLSKKTKAMWASSYFFSYLGKNLIEPFKDRDFVLPFLSKEEIWTEQDGIGRFPDRYIFEAKNGDYDRLKIHTSGVIKEIASQVALFLDVCASDVDAFLENYLKIYFFEKELSEGSNVPKECNSLLDLMEMQDNYNLIEGKNYLNLFFEHDDLSKSFLVEDAFDEKRTQLFNALDDIADKETRLLKVKRMAYHNYVAIIAADGDSMSKATEYLIKNNRDVNECLSKPLYEFGKKIADIVNKADKKENYYGQIIYMGGDDLLLFSPVKYGNRTVFDFIEEFSIIFNEKLKSVGDNPPTISFGVSIAYVKYPMRESLQRANDLLKEAKTLNLKNAIAFSIQKHSGQTTMGVLSKNGKAYKLVHQLTNQFKGDNKMISSIIYWLENNKQMIQVILGEKEEEKKSHVINYIQNSLNESIHRELTAFFDTLAEFITIGNTDESTFDLLISTLRFIHFLNTEKDE